MTLACQMLSHETLVLIIREEVVASVGTCTCHIAYTSRNLRDPECAWHGLGETFVGRHSGSDYRAGGRGSEPRIATGEG